MLEAESFYNDMVCTFPELIVQAGGIRKMMKLKKWNFSIWIHTAKPYTEGYKYHENVVKKFGDNDEYIFHIAQHQSHFFVYDFEVPGIYDTDIIYSTWRGGRVPITSKRTPKAITSLKLYWLMLHPNHRAEYFPVKWTSDEYQQMPWREPIKITERPTTICDSDINYKPVSESLKAMRESWLHYGQGYHPYASKKGCPRLTITTEQYDNDLVYYKSLPTEVVISVGDCNKHYGELCVDDYTEPLFGDLATVPGSKTKINVHHVFYADFETRHGPTGLEETYIFCMIGELNAKSMTCWGVDAIYGMYEFFYEIAMLWKEKGIGNFKPIVYFHNLGFDGTFILRHNVKVLSEIRPNNRKRLSIRVQYKGMVEVDIHFKDSLAIKGQV
jgi:hypothetical protein